MAAGAPAYHDRTMVNLSDKARAAQQALREASAAYQAVVDRLIENPTRTFSPRAPRGRGTRGRGGGKLGTGIRRGSRARPGHLALGLQALEWEASRSGRHVAAGLLGPWLGQVAFDSFYLAAQRAL